MWPWLQVPFRRAGQCRLYTEKASLPPPFCVLPVSFRHRERKEDIEMATVATQGGNNTATIILTILIVAILAVGAVWMMQDHRSGSERVGDAVTALPHGVDKAADKLGDQAPAQNVKRNVKDATN